MQRILLFAISSLFALSLQGQGLGKQDSTLSESALVEFELRNLVAEVLRLKPIFAKNPCDSTSQALLSRFFGGVVLDTIRADLSRSCRLRSRPRFTRSSSELRKIEVLGRDSAVLSSHESFGFFLFWLNGTWHWSAKRSEADARWRVVDVSKRRP